MRKEWTEDEVAILRKRWRVDGSAATIAKALDRSRNSVIGKLKDLGMLKERRGVRAQSAHFAMPADVRKPEITLHQLEYMKRRDIVND